MEKYRAECAEYGEQEEDVLSYALFPQVATNYFKYRAANKYHVDTEVGSVEKKIMPV